MTVAFKRLLPRKGTVIPESHRPQGSTNAALHELPAFREHTVDLIGVVLYLPRSKHIVVPFKHHSGGMGAVIVEGDAAYPRGGHHVDVSDWELQRAERVAIVVPRRQVAGGGPEKTLRDLADGGRVWVEVEQTVEVEPDPVCIRCGLWLNRPGLEVEYTVDGAGPECVDSADCLDRQSRNVANSGVYRAPVQS